MSECVNRIAEIYKGVGCKIMTGGPISHDAMGYHNPASGKKAYLVAPLTFPNLPKGKSKLVRH